MDDTFDQTLKKLEDKVTQFTDHKSSTYTSNIKRLGSKINLKALIIYTAPFIITAIALSVWKPSFVSDEVEDEQGEYITKVSFKRVIISSLIFGAILDGLVILYLRKKEIKL